MCLLGKGLLVVFLEATVTTGNLMLFNRSQKITVAYLPLQNYPLSASHQGLFQHLCFLLGLLGTGRLVVLLAPSLITGNLSLFFR